MIPEFEPSRARWSDEEQQHFMQDRARLLRKLLSDRQAWQDSHTRLGGRSVLKVTWLTQDGSEQQTWVTSEFLQGHTTVLRAVACDLIICGDEGVLLAEHLFSEPHHSGHAQGEQAAQ